jgi:hypothetical protein
MSTLKVNSIEASTGTEVDINATLGTIPGIVISGVTTVAAGSTSAPAITPSGDTNTGIFFPDADTIAFAEGGVEVARINSSGNLGIGTTNPTENLNVRKDQNGGTSVRVENNFAGSSSNAAIRVSSGSTTLRLSAHNPSRTGFKYGGPQGGYCEISIDTGLGLLVGTQNASPLILGTNDNEALRIDSSQRVGIGTTNPTAKLEPVDTAANPTVAPVLFIQRPNNIIPASIAPTNAELRIKGHSSNVKIYAEDHSANPLMILTGGGNLGIGTTNPTAKLEVNGNSTFNGSFTLRSNNTVRGYFGDVDGDTNIQIRAENALTFKAGGNTERARFNSTGAFVLAGGTTTANGIGIAFPATQSASTDANTLDDYEEGTFTPSYSGGVSSVTYGSGRNGYYVKIGRMVTIWINIMTDAVTVSSSGTALTVTGLPFTSTNDTESPSAISIGEASRWLSNPPQGGQIPTNSASVSLYSTVYSTATDPTSVTAGNMNTGVGNKNICRIVACYMV